jgi:23S rRNA (guanosine2251-2'-O)-methyltransferase
LSPRADFGGDVANQIIYGRNPVAEAERGRRRVHRVWRSPETPAGELERLCGSPDHQGVVAEVDPYPYGDPVGMLRKEGALLVALDQVQDPQNLGSICRTAECAGADGVVIPERRAVEVTPAVCKASAGAVEHLPVARVRNLADFLADARRAGCWSYGAAVETGEGRTAVPYDQPDYAGAGVVLVLGSEGGGLRPRVAGACDELIALPLRGRIASLGVSAAAAALLYEILQSRAGGVDNAS